MKVALVGLGEMGSTHFKVYNSFDDIEFVSAFDLRKEIFDKYAAIRPDMRFYTDYNEMLEKEKPDIVDICTPTFLHAEHAITAMRAGAHVICEKPMALNIEQTARIIEASKETKKEFMTAQISRFSRANAYLFDAVKTNKHGKLLKLILNRISTTPKWSVGNWFMDKEKSRLAIFDLMIHDVDFMQSLLGQPNDIVGAQCEFDGMTNFASAIYLYDGCSVTIETGWYDTELTFNKDFYAIFENGYLKYEGNTITECGKSIDISSVTEIKTEGINIDFENAFTAECRYFLDCIKTNKKPSFVPPESTAASIAIAEKTIEKLTKI